MKKNQDYTQYVFFLGGHDAEMCEIAEILKSLDILFYDKNLSWGNARASMYRNEIQKHTDKICVFIELKQDTGLPPESIIINHHGENAGGNMPSSLEQAADMLGTTLSRRRGLIAINDKAHIKGMEKAGASPEEIREIRAFDRHCQGVTKKEETYAEKISGEFSSTGLLDILEIPFVRTSPVTDRLHGKFQNLFIITPVDINFFGTGEIVIKLHNRYKKSWCGGDLPEQGFWGMRKDDSLNDSTIEEITSFIKESLCIQKK